MTYIKYLKTQWKYGTRIFYKDVSDCRSPSSNLGYSLQYVPSVSLVPREATFSKRNGKKGRTEKILQWEQTAEIEVRVTKWKVCCTLWRAGGREVCGTVWYLQYTATVRRREERRPLLGIRHYKYYIIYWIFKTQIIANLLIISINLRLWSKLFF